MKSQITEKHQILRLFHQDGRLFHQDSKMFHESVTLDLNTIS